jgi:hypothetical protein
MPGRRLRSRRGLGTRAGAGAGLGSGEVWAQALIHAQALARVHAPVRHGSRHGRGSQRGSRHSAVQALALVQVQTLAWVRTQAQVQVPDADPGSGRCPSSRRWPGRCLRPDAKIIQPGADGSRARLLLSCAEAPVCLLHRAQRAHTESGTAPVGARSSFSRAAVRSYRRVKTMAMAISSAGARAPPNRMALTALSG